MLKFELLAADLKKQIELGNLKASDKLPTVVELCEQYEVSKATVRHALDLLIKDGYVTSRRGSGIFVTSQKVHQQLSDSLIEGVNDRAAGFTQQHAGSESCVTSCVYDFRVEKVDGDIAMRLSLNEYDFVYYICRTRKLNDLPITIEYTYMPVELVPGLSDEHVNNSIYTYLKGTLGFRIASFHRIIRAVAATKEEAQRLEIGTRDPLLEFEQVGYLDTGVAFEYSISRNVGSRTVLNNITLG